MDQNGIYFINKQTNKQKTLNKHKPNHHHGKADTAENKPLKEQAMNYFKDDKLIEVKLMDNECSGIQFINMKTVVYSSFQDTSGQ